MKPITEIEALQNAANDLGIEIRTKYQEDRRRSINKYFAMYKGNSVSPVLDYDQMNYFLLGWRNAIKHL